MVHLDADLQWWCLSSEHDSQPLASTCFDSKCQLDSSHDHVHVDGAKTFCGLSSHDITAWPLCIIVVQCVENLVSASKLNTYYRGTE